MSRSMFTPKYPFHLYTENVDENAKDVELIDELIEDYIDMGGVVVYCYRLLGTPLQERDYINNKTFPDKLPALNIGEFLGIQDPLLGENRDRLYDLDSVPRIRGTYVMSQNDMIYGQFGAQGLNNDVYSMEFHMKSIETQLNRRFIIGDVLEFPHLKDVSVSGKITSKLYEVVRTMRSPKGWDAHYAPHIISTILRPVRDQQEFIQFMERKDQYGKTLAEQISTYDDLMKIQGDLEEKAQNLMPFGVYDTTKLYYDPQNPKQLPSIWDGGGAIPPNGLPVDEGMEFPQNPIDYSYFLRRDFYPNRLYQYYNGYWKLRKFDEKLEWQNYAWIKDFQSFLNPPKI